jgi:hypothetical protein
VLPAFNNYDGFVKRQKTTFYETNNYHCRQKQSTTTKKGNTLWVLPFTKIDGAIDDIFYDFIKIKQLYFLAAAGIGCRAA